MSSALPIFSNPLIEELYRNDMRVDHNLVKEILSLPRETLIDDLHKVLRDSIDRFHYFSMETEWKEDTHDFPIHALFLLTELRSEQSLAVILNILRQGNEYIEFWFNDFLTEDFWETIFWLGMNKLDDLAAFMKEEGVYCYSKTEISEAVAQITLHYPERKKEAIDWFKNVFSFYLVNAENEALFNGDLVSLMVCDVVDINGSELQQEIVQLYENGLAFPGIAGTLDKVLFELGKILLFDAKRETHTIFLWYEDILKTWNCYTNNDDIENDNDLILLMLTICLKFQLTVHPADLQFTMQYDMHYYNVG